MKLFFRYVYQYRYKAALLLIFTTIFALIFLLYDIKAEAAIYGGLICAVIALAMISINFIKFRKKHLLMRDIYINLPLMDDKIPKSDVLVENDLINIIDRLYEINISKK